MTGDEAAAGGVPQRVLLVLATSTGGVGRHVHGLAAGLVARGCTVVVACPPVVEEQLGFAAAGARVVPVPITDRPHPPSDARVLSRLRVLIAGSDVVHAHGLRAGALACLAAGRSSAPLVVTLHNAAPATRWTAQVYALLERIVARRADVVLAVSADLAARQRQLGARRTALAVVPGPRPPQQVTDRHTARAALGVTDDQPLVVVVARLAAQKGLPLLLDAAARLRELDVLFLVAGDGPMREDLQARIDAQHLPVRLLGQRGDVFDLYAAADVVASTAVWEGQPIGLQEALHAGAAVVATAVGGTPDVLGDAAVLVPAGDAAAFAAAVADVLTDPGLRAGLQRRAHGRAAALPTAEDAVEAALAAYATAGRS